MVMVLVMAARVLNEWHQRGVGLVPSSPSNAAGACVAGYGLGRATIALVEGGWAHLRRDYLVLLTLVAMPVLAGRVGSFYLALLSVGLLAEPLAHLAWVHDRSNLSLAGHSRTTAAQRTSRGALRSACLRCNTCVSVCVCVCVCVSE